MTLDVELDHLDEVVFVRLLHCKVPLPLPAAPHFSILPSLEEVTKHSPHLRVGVMLYFLERGSTYINYSVF